jgi:hypothetical protein
MKVRQTGLLCAAAFVGIAQLLCSYCRADEFRLEVSGLPQPLLVGNRIERVIEPSGVQPIGDGSRILVAHDKHPALFVVETASGRIIGQPITSPKFPTPTKDGAPKWEGMARDNEGNFYVISAHTGKTDEERNGKRVLLRFRVTDGDSPAIEDASVLSWHVARSLGANLQSEGLPAAQVAKRKVEGLAIRESKDADGSIKRELLIGLRAPTDKVRVFTADITNTPSPDAELDFKPAFSFSADPHDGQPSELTSLDYVPELAGSLVVTATEDSDNAFHGNTLFFVPDAEPPSVRKIATFEVAMKAEGLAILGVDKTTGHTAVKLVITYDNDPHTTKIPSRLQSATLVRESK